MSISQFAINKPVTVLMLVIGVIFVGYLALNGLGIDLFPDIDFPIAFIQAAYSGVDPAEMENIVTKPVEDEIATVSDIDRITSYSVEGFSQVVIQFKWGADIDVGAADLREKVDIVKRRLPSELDSIIVQKLDIDAQPVMAISIAGEMNLVELRSLVDNEIKPLIERASGVASASISGGLQREIHINVDLFKLEEYKIPIGDIISAISSDNRNIPAGDLEEGQFKYLIKAEGQVNSVEELAEITVKKIGNSIIKIGDIAEVRDSNKEVSSISRMNGKSSVNISLQKESGANPVKLSDDVKKTLINLRKRYPSLTFEVGQDNSDFIRDSIGMVQSNAIMGALLAIIVLFVFLKNIRSTVIIGIAIPVSIITTFSMMYLKAGMTLNLMTLGGLALGIGMLLDNSIVVLENIYRHFVENPEKTRKENSASSSDEVAMPVLASTLTTIAVFAPIAFVPEMVGEIFFNLSLAIVFALISSYFVAFTVIPALSSKFLKVNHASEKPGIIFEKIKSSYNSFLKLILKSKKNTIFYFFGVFGVFVLSLFFFPPTEFFPSMDRGTFTITVDFAEGTKLDEVNRVASNIEDILDDYDEVDKVITNLSLGRANFTVTLVPVEEREITTKLFIDEVREKTKNLTNVKMLNFGEPQMGPGGSSKPVQIRVYGDDYDKIENYCEQIAGIISGVDGIKDVDSGVKRGRPEVKIFIKRDKIRDLDLNFNEVGNAVRNYVYGTVAGKYKDSNNEFDIRVKLDEKFTGSIDELSNLRMIIKGKTVVLADIADIKLDYGYTTIQRRDKKRVLTVQADIVGRPLGLVIGEISNNLNNFRMEEGYEFEFGGDEEERRKSFGHLFTALIAAIFLVYMIMASQFESLGEPFVIMFTIPLSIIGVVIFLNLFGQNFSVTAIIGIIMLAGIVVNNGILLIDYINAKRHKENMDRTSAVLAAGNTRIRPILMTTATTILGMLPLALGIGAGADFFQPLAITVIGGLLVSSFLTLTFIPATYVIFDSLKARVIKLVNRSS